MRWLRVCALLPGAAAAAAACDNTTFPELVDGVVYSGLHRAEGASSAAACQQACCDEGSACHVWQFAAAPPASPVGSCWVGPAGLRTKPQQGWLSRGRGIMIPTPPPAPPAPAPAPPSALPVPTAAQLAWQRSAVGAIGHFNMGTFQACGIGTRLLEGSARDGEPFLSLPPPETFAPTDVDTEAWVRALKRFGAQRAVLVVSHGCGYNTFPSRTAFPEFNFTYSYSVANSPWKGGKGDIAREFVAACRRHGVLPGFYHGAINNAFLNVEHGRVGANPRLAGQAHVTQDQYTQILLANLRQLWTDYGDLAEVWFDGGFPPGTAEPIAALLKELQPSAVAFQGPGDNVVRWCGTEGGHVTYPFWSTTKRGAKRGPGSPDGTDLVWAPGEADTCFQTGHRRGASVGGPYGGCWFYNAGMVPKSLGELVDVWHDTIGSNAYLLLDWTPMQNGTMRPDHVARYEEFGDWLRGCYGAPVASVDAPGGTDITLPLPVGAEIDRVVIDEDQANGQRIREYTVSVDGVVAANGSSVGNRRIAMLDRPRAGAVVTVAVRGVGGAAVARVAAHNCSREPAPEGCSYVDDFAYKAVPSITLGTVGNATAQKCCAACRAAAECAVFVLSRRSCTLLSANQGGGARRGALSGSPAR